MGAPSLLIKHFHLPFAGQRAKSLSTQTYPTKEMTDAPFRPQGINLDLLYIECGDFPSSFMLVHVFLVFLEHLLPPSSQLPAVGFVARSSVGVNMYKTLEDLGGFWILTEVLLAMVCLIKMLEASVAHVLPSREGQP